MPVPVEKVFAGRVGPGKLRKLLDAFRPARGPKAVCAPARRREEGTAVELTGLAKRADLNGQRATVRFFVGDQGRYSVKLDADAVKL